MLNTTPDVRSVCSTLQLWGSATLPVLELDVQVEYAVEVFQQDKTGGTKPSAAHHSPTKKDPTGRGTPQKRWGLSASGQPHHPPTVIVAAAVPTPPHAVS
jgi:hypothetical protein